VVALALGIAGCSADHDKAPDRTRTLAFQLTDRGCEPAAAKVGQGPATVKVSNAGATNVTTLEL
jgi:hypothetical protein